MSKILINIENSFTRLSSNDPSLLQRAYELLFDTLKYVRPGSGHMMRMRTGHFKNLYNHLIDKNFKFPTGLTREAVSALMKNGFTIEINDLRIEPKLNKIHYRLFNKFPELRYYQKEAIEKALEAKRGCLELCTGAGKSVIIYNIIKSLGLKTLILVPSLSLLDQVQKQLTHYFSARCVGVCGGGKKQTDKQIIVGTPQSVLSILDQFKEIDLLINDEAHHVSSEVLRTINQALEDTYYRFYFSATAFRNDGTDLELFGVTGSTKIYQYTTQQGIKDGHITAPLFIVYPFKHNGMDKSVNWAEELNALTTNEKYNQLIADIVARLDDRKVLIFVERIQHGEVLEKMIPGSVFIHGGKDASFNQSIIKALSEGRQGPVVATKIVGEGCDLISVDTLILGSVGQATSGTIQKLGRILRPSPGKEFAVLIDFDHKDSKFLSKHYKARKKIYKSYNTQIIQKESI